MKKAIAILVVLSFTFLFGSFCYSASYETEPNNDQIQADALVSSSPIIGQLSSKTDQDWYYVCISDVDVINVSFYKKYYSGQSSWSISIEDSSNNLLSKTVHYGYKGDETSTSFAAVSGPGIYYIGIEVNANYLYGGDANYTLTTSVANQGECPTNNPKYDTDGIWQFEGQNYFLSVHVNGSVIIGITYIPGAGESYLAGNISGNTGNITSASNLSQFNASFTFTSDTTATLTIINCVPYPNSNCLFPAGLTINATKVF
jgi:hypothetical protein